MAGYKVLITASGLGSRLGNLTKFTNKGLVRIGKKPALSYIIESYPDDVEFVVTLLSVVLQCLRDGHIEFHQYRKK